MPARQSHRRRPKAVDAGNKPSKGQRLESMARKKDERAARKKERKSASNEVSADDKNFGQQLATMGLKVREVIGDGNCLFRALADQLDGDDHAHSRHRQDVVRYITEHRADFEPFIEDDVPFTKHVQNLALDGTYGGNDSIVAFARLHKLTVVIHQVDSPAWEVHGESVDGTSSKSPSLVRQLHISYHNGDHYASVRRLQDNSDSPANVHVSPQAQTVSDTSTERKKNAELRELADCCDERAATQDCPSTPACEDLKFVERVLEVTRCKDHQLVTEICAEAGYFDVDMVCSHVLAFMEGVRSSSSSTTSDGDVGVDLNCAAAVASSTSAGAKPKSRQRQTTTRRQRKQEKKARAAHRHQAAAAAAAVSSTARLGSSDEEDCTPFVITQQLKVLQI